MSGVRCQVSGVRCQVCGATCERRGRNLAACALSPCCRQTSRKGANPMADFFDLGGGSGGQLPAGDQVIRWAAGQVTRWAGGQVIRWAAGQMTRWAAGQVTRWAGVDHSPGQRGQLCPLATLPERADLETGHLPRGSRTRINPKHKSGQISAPSATGISSRSA